MGGGGLGEWSIMGSRPCELTVQREREAARSRRQVVGSQPIILSHWYIISGNRDFPCESD